MRGPQKRIISNTTAEEATLSASGVTAFTSDGFSVYSEGSGNENRAGDDHVAWCWKANGSSTTTNVNGSIISQISANPTTGFSITTYTGTGSNASVGHGLGAPAKFIMARSRDTSQDWAVFHAGAQETGALRANLNSTANFADNPTVWQDVAPTSTTFSVGSDNISNKSGDRMVAYCWSEIPGFSSFLAAILETELPRAHLCILASRWRGSY